MDPRPSHALAALPASRAGRRVAIGRRRTAVGSRSRVTPNCSRTVATIRSAKASSSAAVAPGSVVSARLCRDDVPTWPSRVPRPKPACCTSQAALSFTWPVARPASSGSPRPRGRPGRSGW